jgi:predicted  nucleic acid-binding Zn-ribbon protein
MLMVKILQDRINGLKKEIEVSDIKIKMLENERDVLNKQIYNLAEKLDRLESSKKEGD